MSGEEKKLAYFDVSAEMFLEIIKERTNVPKDSSVLHVETNVPWREIYGSNNIVRIYIESEEFPSVKEGQYVMKLDVYSVGDNEARKQ